MKVETFLPIFSGTYGTVWEFDGDRVDDEEGNIIDSDTYTVNHKEYVESIAKFICGFLEMELKDFVSSIEFQSVYCPREYNFHNDSAYVCIDSKIDQISKYIWEHKEAFKTYLKDNYTSYDGFISNHSNDFEVWKQETNNFTDFTDEVYSHKAGAILQFICENEGIDEADIQSKWMENDGCYNYIKEIQK